MLGDDILYLPATELGRRLRSRAISPVELTQSYLDRIGRLDPRLKAFVTVAPERALADARRAEQEIAAGKVRGPLHGIPVGVKDILAAIEGPTTAQSLVLDRSWGDGKDALVVRRLRDAGLLDGKEPGAKVGRPSAEQAEIARLRRRVAEAEAKLATTQTALEIMGKAHALLEQLSESAETEQPRKRH